MVLNAEAIRHFDPIFWRLLLPFAENLPWLVQHGPTAPQSLRSSQRSNTSAIIRPSKKADLVW